MIKSAIFDVDGTILDSMQIWNDVGSIYLKNLGYIPEKNLGKILFEMSLSQGAEYLKVNYSLPYSVDEIINGVLGVIDNFYAFEVQPKSNVAQLFNFLNKNNINMIIATSSDKTQIKNAFERLEFLQYFKDIITCNEVGKSKNHPDIYLKCLEILGSKPNETLVFEDALFAIRTANSINLKTVGVFDNSSKDDTNSIKSLAKFYIQDFEKVADWGHHLLSL